MALYASDAGCVTGADLWRVSLRANRRASRSWLEHRGLALLNASRPHEPAGVIFDSAVYETRSGHS